MPEFKDLNLAEPLLRAVSAEGYSTPTPIQAQVIPALLNGEDVIGIAQTGTGKTAAFVLPLLNHLAQERKKPQPKSCKALIIVPTRELAVQIADNIRTYAQFMRVSVAVVLGGVKYGPQIKSLSAGADIVVATPGRLLDHMKGGVVHLNHTQMIVLDEADQMLDFGFVPSIRAIMEKLPEKRQTVLMSATMPPPIRALAKDFLRNPTEIAVAQASRPIELITQLVKHTEAAAKREVLTGILSDAKVSRAIVFTRTKRGADKVHKHLEDAGLSAGAIHGNKSQTQRERVLADFRNGGINVLVATDIAARGIDVDDVSHVINFELPEVAEAYVHRIGRTARAGRSGVAISLCDPAERGLLRDIERLIGNRLHNDGAAPDIGHDFPSPKRPKNNAPKNNIGARKPAAGSSSRPRRRKGPAMQGKAASA